MEEVFSCEDILMKILCYTGEYIPKLDGEEPFGIKKHHFRRDVLQLYCTSKRFTWLKHVWIMGLRELHHTEETEKFHTNFDAKTAKDYFITSNIFGDRIGPVYVITRNLQDLQSYIISAYGYYNEKINPENRLDFLTFEFSMTRSTCKINDKRYRTGINNTCDNKIEFQLKDQWMKKDTQSYNYVTQRRTETLVRKKIIAYPEYIFTIPEEYEPY